MEEKTIEDNVQVVCILDQDRHLDLLPYAAIMQKTGSSEFKRIQYIPDFFIQEAVALEQLITLANYLNIKQLVDRFQPTKTRKQYSLPELWKHELIGKQLKRFVDSTIGKILEIAQTLHLPTFSSSNNGVLFEELSWEQQAIHVQFFFERNSSGIDYSIQLKNSEQVILPPYPQVDILSGEPGFLQIDSSIYQVESEVNGNQLYPFTKKPLIHIPAHMEQEYFRKYILKTCRNADVHVEGFDLLEINSFDSALLQLVCINAHEGKYGLRLEFLYQENQVVFQRLPNSRMVLNDSNEGIQVIRVKRNLQAEEELAEIVSKGKEFCNGILQFEETEGTSSVIQFLAEKKEEFLLHNIYIDAKAPTGEELALLVPKIEHQIHSSKDWFDIQINIFFGSESIPFSYILPYIKQQKEFISLPSGKTVQIPHEWFAQFSNLSALGKEQQEGYRLTKAQYQVIAEAGFSKAEEFICKIDDSIQVPETITATLRPYQEYGFQWLSALQVEGFNCLLADDMGLGKTLQTISFLAHIKEKGVRSIYNSPSQLNQGQTFNMFEDYQESIQSVDRLSALIIVPLSLVDNWVNELQKFWPDAKPLVHIGIGRGQSAANFVLYDVIITTYTIIRNDNDLFQQMNFSCIVMDESQAIKNSDSLTFKAIMQLESQSRISLTGTPIENSLKDLWSQMEFLHPGILGKRSVFQQQYLQEIEKDPNGEVHQQLKRIIQPFILRRTKQQVAQDLPDLISQTVFVDMTEEQLALYEEEKSKARNLILDNAVQSSVNKVIVLKTLLKLRQIANSPVLYDKSAQESSGKFEEVSTLLQERIEANSKVLIFSQFTSHLDLYTEWCKQQSIPYSELTGSHSPIQRTEAVEQFQNAAGGFAFFISLKAGGTGLNLTAADYVFLLDPWWNPAAEQQAIARAHRIGQKKSVIAYKFISSKTVEEKIVKLQEEKQRLADSIVESTNVDLSPSVVEFLLH